MSRKKLGRGLDALLGSQRVEGLGDGAADLHADTAARDADRVPVDQIYRGPYQPRLEFDEAALGELAASIRVQGLLQPIVVRPRVAGGYELIAGERRWRAAQLAGLTEIPAVVRAVSDAQASAMALVENVQRENLSPLEEAGALARLRDEFSLTQAEVAEAIGKSRVAVTNLLRLLNLTREVRQMLVDGDLEMGHARALLALEGAAQIKAAQQVAARTLSVRQTEAMVRRLVNDRESGRASPRRDPDTGRLEQDLSERVGAPVRITSNAKGAGTLVIRYSSFDELDGILEHIR